MTEIPDPVPEPMEAALEEELETEEFPEEPGRGSSVMPWLLPVIVIVAFFAFVAALVLWIL